MARITAELTGGTVATISNGRHTWRADEPPEANGTDVGPDPYELLLGSLAACACITIALYTRYKGIALRSIHTSYEFDRIHADDCEDCDTRADGWIERITSRIRIAGEFDDAQRNRLTQVAKRCPVHKTLANGIHLVDHVDFE